MFLSVVLIVLIVKVCLAFKGQLAWKLQLYFSNLWSANQGVPENGCQNVRYVKLETDVTGYLPLCMGRSGTEAR